MEFDLGMVAICRQTEEGVEVQETWPVHLEGWLALGWRLVVPPDTDGDTDSDGGRAGPELDEELQLDPEAGVTATDQHGDSLHVDDAGGEASGQATGDGPSPYEAMTKAELLDAARALGLEVKGSSSRADVLEALRNHQAVQSEADAGEEPEPVPGDLLI
jgi:hypothetical protein